MYPILTNKIKITIDYNLLNSCFDLFEIKTENSYFKSGSYILDAPLLESNVKSIYFENGKSFYVLMKKSFENITLLKSSIDTCKEKDFITISSKNFNENNNRIIIQLLLNSLGSYKTDFLKFNNLTGHLYCYNPKWIIYRKKNGEKFIAKIPCLELNVTEDLRLNLSVHTFTSCILKREIIFKKKKFEDYPKFILGAKNTLRRKLRTENNNAFIMRQTANNKTQIPFLDLQSIDKFNATKCGVLASVIENFNNEYKGIAKIEFEEINNYESLDFTRKIAKENKQIILQKLKSKKIRIIDMINDNYSQSFCEKLSDVFLNEYNIKIKIGKRISKDALNICLIHNKEYYCGNDDPYERIYTDSTIQHITLEDFDVNSKFAVSTIIHELIIKDDLKNNKITLFNWEQLNFSEPICFGLKTNIENENRFFFMNVQSDGDFIIEESKFDLFNMNQYNELLKIFDADKNIIGVIKQGDNISVIEDTNWITIPQILNIKSELESGNNKLRGKEKRDELLSSTLDIKNFQYNDNKYYFVGDIGEGMRYTVNKACNIRKFKNIKGLPIDFNNLMPLMNVTFVRNGQLTVIPFPFKYLKEYIRNLL